MKKYLIFLTLFNCIIYAGDATSCIQLRSTNNAQMMKNTCPEPIVVHWCHSLKAECGKDGRYYQLNTVIEPNKETGNQYSTPLGVNIEYVACYGDYNSFKRTDDKGGYICKEPKKLPDDKQVMTSTAGAHTQEESCASAKKMAQKDADIGECSCELRGKTYICKVLSTKLPDDKQVMTTTASGTTEDEACSRAKTIAGKDSDLSECSCTLRGKTYICKLQSVGIAPEREGFIIKKGKDLIKEEFNCDPKRGDKCKYHEKSNPGGIRG